MKFSAKISTQTNFWELDSQDPILFPPLGQRSFTYRAINIWNTLCSSLKQSASIDNFKRCLKKQLLQCFLDPN